MEIFTLGMFSLLLVACILMKFSILYALAAGYVLFFLFSLKKGLRVKEVLKISLQGIYSVRNILLTFLLIGMLTGLWRASGTIAAIIDYCAVFIQPSLMLLATFLLNCLISFLTGTAFGCAATMGAICMTMALTMGLHPALVGGAVLSGAYFGDRCSPVSTSALLISELTKTNIFHNIRLMMKTGLVPLLLSCLIYGVMGFLFCSSGQADAGIGRLFSAEFRLGLLPLLPALAVLVLALARVNVKITMLVSILCCILICLFWQQDTPLKILRSLVFGYTATDPTLSGMMNGGGIVSMLKVSAIVCLSSSYAGIFRSTKLLAPMKGIVTRMAERLSNFTVMLPVSVLLGMIACNQTLTIMLTEQLCRHIEPDAQKFAIHLENSAVMVAPLIPWSIAGAVPLSSCGAPTLSLVFACYVYLLPLWILLRTESEKLLRGHRDQ